MPILDVRGDIFDAEKIPHRIVSLVPSITESFFAFGVGARAAMETLAGRGNETSHIENKN